MTYEEYLEQEKTKALQALIEERARYTYAQQLFQNYQIRMASLRLKPLTWLEIGDRLTELEIAERDLGESYSDTELNRARFNDLQAA